MDVGSAHVCTPPLLPFSSCTMRIMPRLGSLDNSKARPTILDLSYGAIQIPS